MQANNDARLQRCRPYPFVQIGVSTGRDRRLWLLTLQIDSLQRAHGHEIVAYSLSCGIAFSRIALCRCIVNCTKCELKIARCEFIVTLS